MMCNPCFMDANQVGYVHELTLDEIKEILDDSISFKPRRQMTVQFSGGEPTMSPHFLEACRYAKDVGYFSSRRRPTAFASRSSRNSRTRRRRRGSTSPYFQFDGVTNDANGPPPHLEPLRREAACHRGHVRGGDRHYPGHDDRERRERRPGGPILDFVIKNSDKMGGVSFQPVSFTGRDEEICDEQRRQQRYTISHMAHELERYTGGKINAYRDWFPLGAMGAPSALADHVRSLQGPEGPTSAPRLLVPPELRIELPPRREPKDPRVVDRHAVLRHGRRSCATSPSSATAHAGGS